LGSPEASVEEIEERDDLSAAQKCNPLSDNAVRFYSLQAPARV
jgi:hypothetical protein